MGAPPPSQIPLLSNLPPEPEMPQGFRGMIKESDSAYVRLAKQGGRPDLLQFKDIKPREHKAKGYPRVDWYYLEDNAYENAANANQETSKE